MEWLLSDPSRSGLGGFIKEIVIMIEQLKKKGLSLSIPGLIMQFIGIVLRKWMPDSIFGLFLAFLGTVLAGIGFAYYAKSKGQHTAWCLF